MGSHEYERYWLIHAGRSKNTQKTERVDDERSNKEGVKVHILTML